MKVLVVDHASVCVTQQRMSGWSFKDECKGQRDLHSFQKTSELVSMGQLALQQRTFLSSIFSHGIRAE